jgi:hypothetical protein
MSSSRGVSAETLKSLSTPDQVESRLGKLEFDDGAPSEETAALLYDNLDFMNGVQAFLGRCRVLRSPRCGVASSRWALRTTRSRCSRN